MRKPCRHPPQALYNNDRNAFRKKLADKPKVNDSERENRPANNNKIGAPKGHQGSSHRNKADRTIRTPVRRCEKCGRGHLKARAWVMKMIYDFPQDGIMKMEKVAHFMGRGPCKSQDIFLQKVLINCFL